MVQKAKDKGKRGAGGGVAGSAGAAAAASLTPEQQIERLMAERDDLKAALEAANQRIQALEASRSDVASRIDSVINSLNNLGDGGE